MEARSGEGVGGSWGLWEVRPLHQSSAVRGTGNETAAVTKRRSHRHLYPNKRYFRMEGVERITLDDAPRFLLRDFLVKRRISLGSRL